MHDHKRLYFVKKKIVFPGWSRPENETSAVHFNAPIEIDGIVEKGVVLHGNCLLDRPDRGLSLELRIQRQPGRRTVGIERIDWRSLDGGHSNIRGRKPWAGRRVSPTHVHAFSMNYSRSEGKMRKGLKAARNFYCKLDTFEAVLKLAGNRLRIKNIEVVERPDWQYSLFDGDHVE